MKQSKGKSKMKVYSTKEAKRIVRKNGWYLDRSPGGGHEIFKHPDNKKIMVISRPLNKMVWEKIVKEFDLNLNV